MDPTGFGMPMGYGYGAQPNYGSQQTVNQLDNVMMAFLSQQGVVGADGMVDKAKFQKIINDAKSLQNQLDASQWSTYKQMADAWAR